ncbi:MAG: hypothetical protein MPJ22_06785, partial [Pirellulales bacterium]|nr:hypothetical protein [Pirellulales bacterium]
NRTVFLRESDPFMPILPSPERQEEFLEEGLKTPPSTPIHSPNAFLKEDRWLFSPPPVLTPENKNLDNFEHRTDTTPHDTDKDQNSKTFKKRVVRPSSLTLSSEGNPHRKRSRPNTVAALIDSNPAKRPDTPITTYNTHSGVHPILLVRPVRLPVGTEPATWNPPSLLQIVSRPTPELVRKLTNSRIPYVNSPVCQKCTK